MLNSISIGDFTIDNNSPVFIIAELSANHNGSLDQAVETIRAAKRAGADAIKFQTYTADTITMDVRGDDFKISQGTLWDGKFLYDLYQEAYTPWDWFPELFRVAAEEELICFSSPFDETSVDFLERFNPPAYKIASFEITDIPLIRKVAGTKKPIIISTGIAESEDIELAVEACKSVGNNNIILLKCTSAYPAPPEEANLIMIKDMSEKFDVYTGLSDHTLGSTSPVVATAFGAKVIEKHFMLDRHLGGPDSAFSLNEKEFTEMVNAIRETERLIGFVDYTLTPKQKSGKAFSRSLYVSKDSLSGTTISTDNIRSVRPGFGMHPKFLEKVLGRTFLSDVKKGDRLTEDLIS